VVESVAVVDFVFLLCLNQADKGVFFNAKVNLFRALGEDFQPQDLLVKQALEF
jgi:hypothetical protein